VVFCIIMVYDLYTPNKRLARSIIKSFDFDSYVDDTEDPDMYQFFDISEKDMSRIKSVLERCSKFIYRKYHRSLLRGSKEEL